MRDMLFLAISTEELNPSHRLRKATLMSKTRLAHTGRGAHQAQKGLGWRSVYDPAIICSLTTHKRQRELTPFSRDAALSNAHGDRTATGGLPVNQFTQSVQSRHPLRNCYQRKSVFRDCTKNVAPRSRGTVSSSQIRTIKAVGLQYTRVPHM